MNLNEKEKLSSLRNARTPRAFVLSGDGGRHPRALLPLPSAALRVAPPRPSVRRHVLLKTKPREAPPLATVITLAEAAKFLKVHRSTLYRMIRQNTLPGAFRVGNDWRINADKMWHGLTQPPR